MHRQGTKRAPIEEPATLHSFFLKQTCLKNESAKLLTYSRANVPCVLKCSHANVSYVLTSSHALCAYVLTYLACLRGHVLTCLACLCAHVPMLLRAYVLMYFACLRAKVPCVLTCLRANVLSVLTYCSSRAYVPTCLVWFRAYVSKQKQVFNDMFSLDLK